MPTAADTIPPDGSELELSIVLPCLDEAETLPRCLEKAKSFLRERNLSGEIIVADNGSTDGSAAIAVALGARLVKVPDRGYGHALRAGIGLARGRFVIMGDADDSYDFGALEPFLSKLREGADLVQGCGRSWTGSGQETAGTPDERVTEAR